MWIIKKLDKLQVLVLAGNKIKSLPDPLAYVTSLRTLLVSGNKLVSARPARCSPLSPPLRC